MNMSLEYYNEGQVRTYEPDYSQFELLAKILSTTTKIRPNAWFKITDDEAIAILKSYLHMYAVVNLHDLRVRAGIIDEAYLITKEEIAHYLIPRYYRDIFREFCRPMTDGNDIWIPNLEAVKGHSLSAAFNIQPLVKGRLNMLGNIFAVTLVPVAEEYLKPEPITVWHESKERVFSRGPIPDYRWKALSWLKHVRFKEFSFATSESETTSRSVITTLIQSTTIINNVSSSLEDGRILIGGATMFTRLAYPFNPPEVLLDAERRFPTEESHSYTPPGTPESSRVRMKKRNKSRNMGKRSVEAPPPDDAVKEGT